VAIRAVSAAFVIRQCLMTRQTEIPRAWLLHERLRLVTARSATGEMRHPWVRRCDRRLRVTRNALRIGRVVFAVTRVAVLPACAVRERFDVTRHARVICMVSVPERKRPLPSDGSRHLERLAHIVPCLAQRGYVVTVFAARTLLPPVMATLAVPRSRDRQLAVLCRRVMTAPTCQLLVLCVAKGTVLSVKCNRKVGGNRNPEQRRQCGAP
jgi:hypothetical protein